MPAKLQGQEPAKALEVEDTPLCPDLTPDHRLVSHEETWSRE